MPADIHVGSSGAAGGQSGRGEARGGLQRGVLQNGPTADDRLREQITRIAAELRENQRVSQAIFDANPHPCIIFDADFRIKDCNPAAAYAAGYASRHDFISEGGRALMNAMPQTYTSGTGGIPFHERMQAAAEGNELDFETDLMVGAEYRPFRCVLRKVEREGTFDIAAYLIDLRKIRAAQTELLRQDALLRNVNAVATKLLSPEEGDVKGAIFDAMKSLCRGLEADRLLICRNFSVSGALHTRVVYSWTEETQTAPGDGEANWPLTALTRVWDTLSHGESVCLGREDCPAPLQPKLNPANMAMAVLVPVFLDGGFWGVIGVEYAAPREALTDIEIKTLQSAGILLVSDILRDEMTQNLIVAREEALASTRAKSEFLSRMSHELRTPLTAVLGMCEMAKKTDDAAQTDAYINKIEHAAMQLSSMLGDILEMSTLEKDKVRLQPVVFCLGEMLRRVLLQETAAADEKGLTLKLEADGVGEAMVEADEAKLYGVIQKLLANAVKFTEKGGEVTLAAALTPAKGGKARLRVDVKDTGIGISEEQQKNLFRLFEQVDGSYARGFGGAGLGLALCRKLLGLMGGDIWVESTLGEGATFSFEVDVVPTAGASAGAAYETGAWAGKTVLVVDDIEINREIICGMLEDSGAQILLAQSGAEAVERFREDPGRFDVILMDVQMPGKSGIDATREIRELEQGAGRPVPILALTANTMDIDLENCMLAGMDGYIAKPVDIDILLQKLAAFLSPPPHGDSA